MTTSVQVSMPEGNHKRVRVDRINISADGVDTVVESIELDHGEESEAMYVYGVGTEPGDGIIKITEID